MEKEKSKFKRKQSSIEKKIKEKRNEENLDFNRTYKNIAKYNDEINSLNKDLLKYISAYKVNNLLCNLFTEYYNFCAQYCRDALKEYAVKLEKNK